MPANYQIDGNLVPLGYEQITGLNTVKTLTVPADARVAIIQAETQNVRWRDDGTNPTAGVGMILVSNEAFLYTGNLDVIKFIEVAASAKLNVSYFA